MLERLSIKKIFIFSLLLHLICAVFSSGFHHFDEHFQIYEFLSYKIGHTPVEGLAWEFHEKVRPWFQVYLYLGLYKTFKFFGITSPFIHAFIFRIFTTIFGVFALYTLVRPIKMWIKSEKNQKLTLLLLNFAWFIPYIQTRTNAESVCASFFIIGLSLFSQVNDKTKLINVFWAGAFLGMSYAVRYQMALMVAFLWFWALFIGRYQLKYLVVSALGILTFILGSILIDFWGYGEWTFAPINLFAGNFSDGRLERSGISPWWYFFKVTFLRGIPPLSIFLLVATLWTWIKRPKHILTWSVFPLFIFHTVIGHKEMRYIFPVILFSPLYLGLFIDAFSEKFKESWKKGYIRKLVKFCICLNVLMLVISILRPSNPSVNFYRYLYNNSQIKSFYAVGESPFKMVGLPIYYYKKDSLSVIEVKDFQEVKNIENNSYYVFFNRGHHIFKMEKEKNCSLLYLTYPKWTLQYNIGNWLSRSRVWSLYKCKL